MKTILKLKRLEEQHLRVLRLYKEQINSYKRGFTLIEVVISMGLIATLCSSFIIGIKALSTFKNEIEVYKCNSCMLSYINYSKLYCKTNKVTGTMFFYKDSNSIKFIPDGTYGENMKSIGEFKFPKGFKYIDNSSKSKQISVNSKGIAHTACTINYTDRKDKGHSITICVGSFDIDVKN